MTDQTAGDANRPGDAGAAGASDGNAAGRDPLAELRERVDTQGQLVTGAFVFSLLAVLLTAAVMFQVSRLRADVALQRAETQTLLRQRAMESFVRRQLGQGSDEAPEAADAGDESAMSE